VQHIQLITPYQRITNQNNYLGQNTAWRLRVVMGRARYPPLHPCIWLSGSTPPVADKGWRADEQHRHRIAEENQLLDSDPKPHQRLPAATLPPYGGSGRPTRHILEQQPLARPKRGQQHHTKEENVHPRRRKEKSTPLSADATAQQIENTEPTTTSDSLSST
jgi:hypothetical protein